MRTEQASRKPTDLFVTLSIACIVGVVSGLACVRDASAGENAVTDQARLDSPQAIWEQAKRDSKNAWDEATETSQRAWEAARDQSTHLWEQVTDEETWRKAQEGSNRLWQNAKENSQAAWDEAAERSRQAWESTKDFSQREWERVRSAVSGAVGGPGAGTSGQ